MAMVIFYFSLSLILYTYLIYPLVLIVLAPLQKKKEKRDVPEENPPSVSVLIAAYNEETVIEEKIRNTMSLDYARDKLEILIGSDGSDDRTDDICRKFSEEIIFKRIEPRQGKANILNTLAPITKGKIILFSDANSMLQPDALKKMIPHFSDPSVGGVCGRLILESRTENVEAAEKIYWSYESGIKNLESKVFSTIGANGGIYALRKELFCEIPKDTIIDDFLISLNLLEQGKRLYFEKDAIAYEKISSNLSDEFWRKVRVGSGNIQTFLRKLDLFHKNIHGFLRFAYISHKVIRWTIPLLLILIYISLFQLYGRGIFTFLFVAYNLSIIIALITIIFRIKNRIFHTISYLFIFNFALLLGYFRYLLGLQKGTWKKAAR